MNNKIKQHIQEYAKQKGWPCDKDSDLIEILTDGKQIYFKIGKSHRWYDEKFVVVDINGMLIGYDWYHTTGDNSASDMGLELNLNSVCEVEEKEKIIKYYEPVKS